MACVRQVFSLLLFSMNICLLPLTVGRPLKVACLQGRPPFVDVVGDKCVGLMPEALSLIMQSTGMEYTIHNINSTVLKDLTSGRPTCKSQAGAASQPGCFTAANDATSVLFNFPTNASQYDVGITFTFATSERLRFVSSSLPLLETQYAVMLSPDFAIHDFSIIKAIIRDVVMYIFSIIILFMVGTSILYILAEGFFLQHSELLEKETWSERLLTCIVAAVETAFTMSSPLELSSPISLAFKGVASFAIMFVMSGMPADSI
jgi:hypothetical protein